MRDYIIIGSAPIDEPCVQVGDPNYREKAIDECKRFITLIRKTLGNEPRGAYLKIMSFEHDFGHYHEVVCMFDDDKKEAVEYAYNCEANAPLTWNE